MAAESRIAERVPGLGKHRRDADVHVGQLAKQGQEESRFRGNWNWASPSPAFNAFQFLNTPPPQRPRLKCKPSDEAGEPFLPDPAILDKLHEVATDAPKKKIAYGPPEGMDVLCTIRDRCGKYRGVIAKDGEARNNANELLGFINMASWECGSADEEYLGCIAELNAFNQGDCVITDALDETAGTLDLGSGYLKDHSGRIVGELGHNGVITGHAETYLGEFEGFTMHHQKTIALYLILLDPGMLNEVQG